MMGCFGMRSSSLLVFYSDHIGFCAAKLIFCQDAVARLEREDHAQFSFAEASQQEYTLRWGYGVALPQIDEEFSIFGKKIP
jgi:hypothetical protein